jgi:hypothetical protein
MSETQNRRLNLFVTLFADILKANPNNLEN